MTNEELKKKIVEVLKDNTREAFSINGKSVSCYDIFAMQEAKINAIADALIAAGIGDVSELKKHRVQIMKDGSIKQLYSGEEVEKIVKEREEYKHRAEVAEKAGRIIQRDMARVFDVSNPRICELIANIWDLAKKQAEKELAEEGKDD